MRQLGYCAPRRAPVGALPRRPFRRHRNRRRRNDPRSGSRAASDLDVHWVVLSAAGERGARGARLGRAISRRGRARDDRSGRVSRWVLSLPGRRRSSYGSRRFGRRSKPDVIFSHWQRRCAPGSPPGFAADLEHLPQPSHSRIRDPEMGRRSRPPKCLCPVPTRAVIERKVELLLEHFGTQRSKDWFDSEVFTGLARLRGSECRAPDGLAEAFHARKLVLQ